MIHEFQIQYTTVDNNGNDKIAKETYVTESHTCFADVETFAYDTFGNLTDIDVTVVKRSRVKEVVNRRTGEQDLVWEATVQETFVIDDVEKTMKYRLLLFAVSFDDAKSLINYHLKQGYNDMELVSLKLTKIKDVLY